MLIPKQCRRVVWAIAAAIVAASLGNASLAVPIAAAQALAQEQTGNAVAVPPAEVGKAVQSAGTAGSGPARNEDAALFASVLDMLRQSYVGPLDESALVARALKTMLGSLDGHSTYMTAQEYREFDTSAHGEFAGIGVVLEESGGMLKVVAPTDGGPCARAGVAAGWTIQAIEERSAAGLSLRQGIEQLRGASGSAVNVTFRDLQGRDVRLALVRERIRVKSVYQRRIGEVGYVRITGFNLRSDEDFAEAIAALQRPGKLSGLVLDLRNNPGGFVDSAKAIAARFLPSGAVIVRTGRDRQSAVPLTAGPAAPALGSLPVTVLVNGGTASAAEILTAALQDNRRASVIGLVTFGKGLVQTVFPLEGGNKGAVSITTLRYYTPAGRSIQQAGIIPDILAGRSVQEARAALRPGSIAGEAGLSNSLSNDTGMHRFEPDEIEGPGAATRTRGRRLREPRALFATPLPGDQDIALDFQIQRALQVLKAGTPLKARSLFPAAVYRRSARDPALRGGTGK